MFSEKIVIGSPVDTWWNASREIISPLVDYFNANPPEITDAAEALITAVEASQEWLYELDCPQQAKEMHNTLLDALNHLRISLRFRQAGKKKEAMQYQHLAHSRYLLLCYLLMNRGIYEPPPLVFS